jgi:uncharacterized protein (TIGR03066 family)
MKGLLMKSLRSVVACCLVLSLAGLAFAEEKKDDTKSNKDKLVGVWEVTKSEGAPAGSTVEFTKDGKMIVTVKADNKTEKVEGTYTVDGDSIKSNLKVGDKEVKETAKIKKLTDKVLVTEDEKGKTDEFKKK